MSILQRTIQQVEAGRVREAQAELIHLLRKAPHDPEVCAAAGLLELNKGNFADALNLFQRAERHWEGARVLVARALVNLRRGEEALAILDGDECADLVAALRSVGRIQESIALARKLKLPSEELMGHVLLSPREAVNFIESCSERNDVLNRTEAFMPLYYQNQEEAITETAKAYAQTLVNREWKGMEPVVGLSSVPKIGLVSSDFRNHAVRHFLMPLVMALKKAGFGVTGYFYAGVADGITKEFQKQIKIALFHPGEEGHLIQEIQKDKIEILVDLNGYSAGGLPALFIQNVCPVLLHAIGYPATTGMPGQRFRLGDTDTDLPENDHLWTEELVKLERPFLCYQPPKERPNLRQVASRNLTFGSFNNFSKISPETVEIWTHVLSAFPNSKCVLKSETSRFAEVREAVLSRFPCHIQPQIEFLETAPGLREHLDAYHHIDIALDTFPYSGTTTTCEALSMGVPVVTLEGRAHRTRVSASILRAANFHEWVATTPEELTHKLKKLASSLPNREEIKSQFESSPLCDVDDYADHLKQVFSKLIEKFELA